MIYISWNEYSYGNYQQVSSCPLNYCHFIYLWGINALKTDNHESVASLQSLVHKRFGWFK